MQTHVTGAAPRNLIDTAASEGSFHTLGRALEAAEMVNVFSGTGPYTFFAPTDAAFKKLPSGTLEHWMKPENRTELVAMIRSHVLPGRSSAADVAELKELRMMQGQTAAITHHAGALNINGAKIIQPDILSSNGVIHGIDTVIVPPAKR